MMAMKVLTRSSCHGFSPWCDTSVNKKKIKLSSRTRHLIQVIHGKDSLSSKNDNISFSGMENGDQIKPNERLHSHSGLISLISRVSKSTVNDMTHGRMH